MGCSSNTKQNNIEYSVIVVSPDELLLTPLPLPYREDNTVQALAQAYVDGRSGVMTCNLRLEAIKSLKDEYKHLGQQ